MGIRCWSEVGAPLAETFAWHERPGAVVRLAPPWQHTRVVEEAASLDGGRAVIRLPGRVPWVAVHEGYDPPHGFADRLVSLPLPWRHAHRFESASDGRTRVTDTVETPVPTRVLVPMFAYRHRQLAEDLSVHRRMAPLAPEPLTVAVTGSSGLIGSVVRALLTTGGHRVVRLVRHPPRRAGERRWDPEHPDPAVFEGVGAVVHLAGASIAGRFTDRHKRLVRVSRVGPTERLARALSRARHGPATLVSASAIGYYGARRGNEVLTEDSARGEGFLADLVAEWERAAGVAEEGGIRVVSIRTGVVLSPRGGVLRLLRPLFELGLGGRVGSGEQWVSWIDIDDVADIYYRAVVDTTLSGAVNATAPGPVTNGELSDTLARVLRRPSLLPVPALGPELLLGSEGASELALASQRVLPDRLTRMGHRFRRSDLADCLGHQLGHSRDDTAGLNVDSG